MTMNHDNESKTTIAQGKRVKQRPKHLLSPECPSNCYHHGHTHSHCIDRESNKYRTLEKKRAIIIY
jgi:hypothetical protein